ncbi:element excision factor XisI family protein [Roseofilum capinflatum]|uniref:Element excision factor XisI family protein n=1 Tax=Roseofilum capinflatum BLCC-M114 TaxID=3022440 RepID=A0ABT7BBR1_9CYAN|nr:element excision factor XisI family protein [Roseofilum capinflatum]MDJ1175733.1 element excision factor XisI family protein [Roseofilum capinflatum BLCC-M114]
MSHITAKTAVLEELHHYNTSRQEKDVFSEIILDKERDHYLLLDVGWKGKEYIYDPFIMSHCYSNQL